MLSLWNFEVKPIGYVRRISPEKDVKDRNLISKLVFRKRLKEALDGIEDLSHLFIIFWMHKISHVETTVVKVHPKEKRSCLSSESSLREPPNHPNPIGLTLVEIVKREGKVLLAKGLDAYDRTPVLDIEPYDKCDNSITDRVPKWLAKIDQ